MRAPMPQDSTLGYLARQTMVLIVTVLLGPIVGLLGVGVNAVLTLPTDMHRGRRHERCHFKYVIVFVAA